MKLKDQPDDDEYATHRNELKATLVRIDEGLRVKRDILMILGENFPHKKPLLSKKKRLLWELIMTGGPSGTRTLDTEIKSLLL